LAESVYRFINFDFCYQSLVNSLIPNNHIPNLITWSSTAWKYSEYCLSVFEVNIMVSNLDMNNQKAIWIEFGGE
jgi:hypothetical protein